MKRSLKKKLSSQLAKEYVFDFKLREGRKFSLEYRKVASSMKAPAHAIICECGKLGQAGDEFAIWNIDVFNKRYSGLICEECANKKKITSFKELVICSRLENKDW